MTYEHHRSTIGLTVFDEPRERRRVWRWAIPKSARVVDDIGLTWFRPLVELPSIIDVMQGGIDHGLNPWWKTYDFDSPDRTLD